MKKGPIALVNGPKATAICEHNELDNSLESTKDWYSMRNRKSVWLFATQVHGQNFTLKVEMISKSYLSKLVFAILTLVSVVSISGIAICDRCEAQDKPNVLVLLLDDADLDITYLDLTQSEKTYFPNIRDLARAGVRFTNAHSTIPLCGPARACFLRSQYASSIGVRVNNPDVKQSQSFTGGFTHYKNQNYWNNDLSTWMGDLTYRNYYVGKYLHTGYMNEKPPGFDEFFASKGSKYFGVSRAINGSPSATGATEYRTTVEKNDVLSLLDDHKVIRDSNGRPFFMVFAPFAPHDAGFMDPNGMVEPKYQGTFNDELQPKDVDYSEANITDKPAIYQRLERLNNVKRQASNKLYRDRLRALKSFDDALGEIVQKLTSQDELDNTYIILLSDNGYQNGEHRSFGKQDPFNRCTQIPLIVRGPNVAANAVANHLVAHIDVAATIVDLADGTVPAFADGVSFASVLPDPSAVDEATFRSPILIENYEVKRHHTPRLDDFIQLQMSYLQVRKYDEIYNEWSTGEREYYDLDTDPLQLLNTFSELTTAEKAMLQGELDLVRNVTGKPRSVISKPFEGFTARPMEIKGLAEAPGGISEVRLVIKNITRNKFWNGTSWVDNSIQVQADLPATEGLLTNWVYNLPLDADTEGNRIRITARAYSETDFANANLPNITATVDGTNPNTGVSTPAQNAVVNRNVTVTGTATDNRGLDEVRLQIKNLDNNRFWNGTGWQNTAKNIILEAPTFGQQNFNWTYSFTPPAAVKVRVTARAYDRVNNRDLSPAIQTFNVK